MASIERQISLLREDREQPRRVDAFETHLRHAVEARYDGMPFYVPLSFRISRPAEQVVYDQLTGETFRMVVLGPPGAGKSTYARKLCLDLARRAHPLSGGLRVAGILLRLRAIIEDANADPLAQIELGLRRTVETELELADERDALDYIDGFTESQVRSFTEQWFAARPELVPSVLATLAPLGDLASSPLMLSVICATYEREGAIASTRVGLYDATVKEIETQWESRRIEAREPMPFWFARILLGRIAWTMLTTPAIQGGVPEAEVFEMAERQSWELHSIGSESPSNAHDFIAFSRERGTVFAAVGVDAGGALLFDFAHRTFLEFFAAEHVVSSRRRRGAPLPETFVDLVESGHTVVAELAAGLYARDHDRAEVVELADAILRVASDREALPAMQAFVDAHL